MRIPWDDARHYSGGKAITSCKIKVMCHNPDSASKGMPNTALAMPALRHPSGDDFKRDFHLFVDRLQNPRQFLDLHWFARESVKPVQPCPLDYAWRRFG